MSILYGDLYLKCIEQNAENCSHRLVIFSAYIKQSALEWLSRHISESVDVTIVVRWNKIDLLSGASDLEIYNFCKAQQWQLRIDTSLHGKLYLFDESQIILGSSNLTNRGLGLIPNSNLEFGAQIASSLVDNNKLNGLVTESVLVDDKLYDLICSEIVSGYSDEADNIWSDEILSYLVTNTTHLWVEECLFTSPSQLLKPDFSRSDHIHDFSLLRLELDQLSISTLQNEFLNSRLGVWAKNIIASNPGINFGGLTAELHNSLLNDPKPYRKDVKDLVAKLVEWLEFCPDKFEITHYTRTLSVKLLDY